VSAPFPLLSSEDPAEQALAREWVTLQRAIHVRPHWLLLAAAVLFLGLTYSAEDALSGNVAAIAAMIVSTVYLVQFVLHVRWTARRRAWGIRAAALEAAQRRGSS
jgi:hypothetical protein